MGLNKSDFKSLDERIKNITSQMVEQIQINSDLPPTIEKLADNNTTYSIMAAILFIDIRKSTFLAENSQAKSMVKIYRSFMRMAVDCVRKNAGVTRQFLGDRIMGVFIDSTDEDGNVSEKAVDKAINAARSLQTVIDFSLNKHLKNNVNGKVIECGIGIDYGKILVTQVGMYGVEADEDKEDEVDCVWVGNTTNYASKYSDIADGGEIFISDNVYNGLSCELKNDSWLAVTKYKGKKPYKGYSINGFYLDYAEELGEPLKIDDDNVSHKDNAEQISNGIKAISELQNKLFNKERELASKEERLKVEKEKIQAIQWTMYNDLFDMIHSGFMSRNTIKQEDVSYWQYMIDTYYKLGNSLGISVDDIRRGISYCLSSIYDRLGLYAKAFDEITFKANKATWVNTYPDTLKWAKENDKIWGLRYDINRRIEQDPHIDKESFKNYYNEVDKYYG